MTSILVRNLAEDVKLGLKERARRNGRSMESEVRALLTTAVRSPEPSSGSEEELETLGARIRARFAHIDTEGLVFPRSTELVSGVDVSESDSHA
jgi:plasmid stability protein